MTIKNDAVEMAKIRIKIEKRALPPEPPPHLRSRWYAAVRGLMSDNCVVKDSARREVQRLRGEEQAYWRARGGRNG